MSGADDVESRAVSTPASNAARRSAVERSSHSRHIRNVRSRHVGGQTPAMSLGDVDDDALHRVVVVAADVPLALERLLVPGFVARAEPELVAAERRVPL